MKKRSALVVVSLAMAGPLVATQHDQSVLNPVGAYTPESLACLLPMEAADPPGAGQAPSPITPGSARTAGEEQAMAAVAEDGGTDHTPPTRSAPPHNPYVGDDGSWQPSPVVGTRGHGTSASYAGAYGYNNATGYAGAYGNGGWQPPAGYGATYRGAYYNRAARRPASAVPVRGSDFGQSRAVATEPRLQAGTFGISLPWGESEHNGSTYDGMPGMRMGTFRFPGFGRGADRSSGGHNTAAVLEMGPFSLPARRWASDGRGSNAEGGHGFHFGPFSLLNGAEDGGYTACTSGLRSRYGASRACGTGLYAGRDFITDYLAAQTAGVIAGLDYPARFAADGIGGAAGSAKVVGKRLEQMEDRLNLILVLLQRLGVSGS